MLNKKITFIGGGNMAEGIINAMIDNKVFDSSKINVYDIAHERLDYLEKTYKVNIFSDSIKACDDSDIILVAVRPQDAKEVLGQLTKYKDSKLIVSICAGITIEKIQSVLGEASKVVRVMPNVLSDSHHGYTGISLSKEITEEDKKVIKTAFSSLGQVIFIPESQFDAFTAFSCAGPAFVMYCISGLIDAGVQSGFSRQDSRNMVLENFIGSGLSLEQTGEHPMVRIDKMTSPAGCTIDGVAVMSRLGLTGILMEAVKASLDRTRKL